MSSNKISFNSSIARKVVMALSGLFLVSFLIIHLSINFISVFDAEMFNSASEFMGTNGFIQFFFQPILIIGVIVHFVMGMYLEYQNRNSRAVKYAMYKGSANASWLSRNMIYSGLVVLAFLGLHFYDFWFPEMKFKYVDGMSDPNRYFPELVEKFHSPTRVILYVLSFIFLALHLMHGFQSSFQSMGVNHKRYTAYIKAFGQLFAIVVPLGFIFIALFHYLTAH